MATERDWAAYRVAVVDVVPPDRAAFRIVPDVPGAVGTWPDGLTRLLVVVTAWNPDSVRLADDVNAARHRILTRELSARGLPWWPATGRDPGDGHAESGVAIPGLPEDEALALGRRHGQAAVYLWTPGAWEVVSCVGDRRETLGWRLAGSSGPPD
jgi:hypothetical protein